MVLIPKLGKSPHHCENYRPISLLNVPSKVLEKIVNRQLVNSINEKGLNNKDQHGFRAGLGTNTALALIYETIASGSANRWGVNVVCRDIKGAFDKVWYVGLIAKCIIGNLPEY